MSTGLQEHLAALIDAAEKDWDLVTPVSAFIAERLASAFQQVACSEPVYRFARPEPE